jgi:putative peptidoglycan lipid II flippase
MITKMLTNESKTVTGAAIIIGLATLGSRIIGIVRDRLFAHYFGAGPMMDAYYASFKIPDLIYNLLIVGALTAGFIPTFTKLLDKDPSRKSAWRLANNVLTIIAVALAIISGLGALFAPHLTTLLFPGFPNATTELAVLFTRIMFISPLLLGISMVLGGILQSLRQFFIYSLAPIFYNLGIIIGAVALVPLLGPTGLAWGVVLGALLHMLVQCYGTYSNGWRWRFTFDLSDASTRTIGALMLPRTFGLAAHHINNIIITSFASFLSIGSVSVYNFANNLQAVPTGLVAIPFALAVFPLLSEMDLPKDNQAFLEKIISTARYILFLIVPIIIILLLLRAQIVRLILGSGAFDWTATIATANTLAFFAIGLIGQALIPLLARAFYAMSNTKTPFFIGLASEVVSITTALIAMKFLGVAGLALGASLGALVNALLLSIALHRHVRAVMPAGSLRFVLHLSLAGLAMAGTVQLLKLPLGTIFDLDRFFEVLLQAGISGTVGLLIYGGLLAFFKVEELSQFALSFKKKWLRTPKLEEGLDEVERLQ